MFLIDVLLIVLTSACIWYCYSLTLKIKSLQENKEEFLKIIKYFDSIISKADESVNNLNELSEKATVKLADNISKAQTLSEDLVFMNEIGSELAEKMEKNLATIRSEKVNDILNEKVNDKIPSDKFSNKEDKLNINMQDIEAEEHNKNAKALEDRVFADNITYTNNLGSVSIPSISSKNIADKKRKLYK